MSIPPFHDVEKMISDHPREMLWDIIISIRNDIPVTVKQFNIMITILDKHPELVNTTSHNDPLLNFALKTSHPNYELVKFLLDRGADPNKGRSPTDIPLYTAMYKDPIFMELLLNYGAVPGNMVIRGLEHFIKTEEDVDGFKLKLWFVNNYFNQKRMLALEDKLKNRSGTQGRFEHKIFEFLNGFSRRKKKINRSRRRRYRKY